MHTSHDWDCWGMFAFDMQILLKNCEHRKRGFHIFNTTAATSEHVKCEASTIGIVGRFIYSMVEPCRTVLSR